MFTQCQKCKAIFRVNLREVTAAKGKLRCGECYSVFDATKTLSNTMPTPFQEVVDLQSVSPFKAATSSNKPGTDKNQTGKDTISIRENSQNTATKPNTYTKKRQPLNKWLLIAAIFLALLLPVQVYFNMKTRAAEEPRHKPDKIQMVNYNVFAHPNESGVLLISATMKNIAKFEQPYPVIEVSLRDSHSRVIALRRFRPSEYLQNYNKKLMLATNQQSQIKLKISDPGSKATRFRFKFY